MIKESSIKSVAIVKVDANMALSIEDTLAIEEPLEIRLSYTEQNVRIIRNISVTMRTPGHDEDLAIGFLFTEGIISDRNMLQAANHCFIACAENKENVIQVDLTETTVPELKNADRNFYTTSSCGVCGKGSINAIKTVSSFQIKKHNGHSVSQELILELPQRLREQQRIFDMTGGLHACALFDAKGKLILLREDVGRHNALDKLIGKALQNNWLPLENTILLLSGRASFELIQKAAMAGISIIAAVGAPSSLAVQLAEEFGITLIGFLREARFNIYTHDYRIKTYKYEDQN
jgi:FdhD protein